MKRIIITPAYRKEEMRKFFYTYLRELSEFDDSIEFDSNNMPIYEWFDSYWIDNKKFPFYLKIEDSIAGLALVREIDKAQYEIAEFYICPEYRNDGNAVWFATEITNLFDGEFTFCTRQSNLRAINFWNKFSSMFSFNQHFDDTILRTYKINKIAPKTHNLNLKPIYFDLIKNGSKILEGRLNDDKRKTFNIGDTINFYKEPEKQECIKAIILDKELFQNFDLMAENLDKKDLGFETSSKQEMINVYRSIYSKENEDKYGVAVFKIKVIN